MTPYTLCGRGTVLDYAYYTTGFNILRNPSNPALTTTVTVSKTQCLDATTSIMSSCAAGYPTWNANTSTCSNAVTTIAYTIRYSTQDSGSSVIDSVTAEITFGNVVLVANTLIEQTFQVSFLSTSHPNPLPKSGNPGYINGKVVLAGSTVTSNGKSAVVWDSNPLYGLTLPMEVVLPGSIRPECSSATDRMHRIPVLFGQTLVSSCTKHYTLSDLKTNCAAIRKDIYTIQTLTASTLNLVGKFGNASILNVQDWIPVINDVPESVKGDKAIADSVTGMCSSLLTEFGIEFLVANFGSVDNPQSGIVGARYNYVSGSFQYRCLNPLDCVTLSALDPSLAAVAPGSSPQPFCLKSTVAFVPVEGDSTTFVPPPPRLLPPLPNDIFYPFQL